MKTGDLIVVYKKDGIKDGFFDNTIASMTGDNAFHVAIVVKRFGTILLLDTNIEDDTRLVGLSEVVRGYKWKLLGLKQPLMNIDQFNRDLPKILKKKYMSVWDLSKVWLNRAFGWNLGVNNWNCARLSAWIYKKYHTSEVKSKNIFPRDFEDLYELRGMFQ